jgi:hypothetical protein
MQTRTFMAAALAGIALAGAGCGEDNGNENPSAQPDSPVNTDTPSADPEGSTPAPNSESQKSDDGGSRGAGGS